VNFHCAWLLDNGTVYQLPDDARPDRSKVVVSASEQSFGDVVEFWEVYVGAAEKTPFRPLRRHLEERRIPYLIFSLSDPGHARLHRNGTVEVVEAEVPGTLAQPGRALA
jgi:hypothetical protein